MSVAYSIVIPAYNEEVLLPSTLAAAQLAMQSVSLEGEIVVADNNSTDATAEIAERAGARVAFEPINQISRARNAGAAAAEGDYLIFLDADTTLSASLLQQALDVMGKENCSGGGALLELEQATSKLGARFAVFWNYLSKTLKLACGCFVFCRRDAFDAIGGFSHEVYAGEEIWFSRRLAKWGKKHGLPSRILTSPRIVSSARKLQWHSSAGLTAQVLLLTLFPFFARSRRFCWLWYKRPEATTE